MRIQPDPDPHPWVKQLCSAGKQNLIYLLVTNILGDFLWYIYNIPSGKNLPYLNSSFYLRLRLLKKIYYL